MPEVLLSSAVQRYLDETKSILKSHYSIASVLKTFLALTPDKPFLEQRSSDVHAYVQARLKAGIRRGTINRELSVISAFVNYAASRWDMEMPNPVKRQWLKPEALRLRYLNPNEAARLIRSSDALRDDLGAFVRLALHTGCRKTELLTLQWSDVCLERRYVVLRPEQTKSNRRRAVPLNQTAMAALKALQQGNETQWVFSTKRGERVKALDWLFRKAVKQAEIEDFRIHDLRHTFASWLVSEGVELVKVRDLLGHTSIKMTERYAHLMPDRLHDAVQVLDLF